MTEERLALDSIELPPEDLSGVPRHLQDAAREHGLALFTLVYSCGIGQHAISGIVQAAHKYRDQSLLQAANATAQMFNEVSVLLQQAKGWTPADIAACDASIRRSIDTKIIVPRDGLVLDS